VEVLVDTIAIPMTAEQFIEWEDRQEGKHEFDGERIVEMTGGTKAHQRLVFNLLTVLFRTLDAAKFDVVQEMRLRIGRAIRYPDVCVVPGHIPQTARTLDDVAAAFEVLSDDTARTDLFVKVQEYAAAPSFQYYVLLDQMAPGALVYARRDSDLLAQRYAGGEIPLPGIGVALPFAAIYEGLSFGDAGG
jgi:Uma2 family endonuclease